ncbi:MAG: hypothetical protein AB7U87_00770 [Candidatus Bipolaricaulis sp.]
MKAFAMALAAVVGLVPAFAQLSYAQALPSSPVVLPVGDELEDTTLAGVDGEAWPAVVPFLVKAARWLGTALIVAERVASSGCQKAVHLAGQAAAKIGELTMRGLSFTAQHPLATNVGVGATGGGLVGGLASRGDSLPERLVDAGIGALGGGAVGGLSFVMTHPRWLDPKP